MKNKKFPIAVCTLVLSAILLSSCAAGYSSNGGMYSDSKASYDYRSDDSVYQSDGDMTGIANEYAPTVENTEAGVVKNSETASERKKIVTWNMSLESKEFDAAAAKINELIEASGGYVAKSSLSNGNEYYRSSSFEYKTASYTAKIPAGEAGGFVKAVAAAGNLTNQNSNIEDITDSYYDITARLSSYKLQEERLLVMLEGATELKYMIEVESKLSEIRYNIERLTASIRRLDSDVEYATVNISLREVIDYTITEPDPVTFGEKVSIALRDGWKGFVAVLQGISIALLYLAPWIVVAGVTLLIVFICVSASKKKRILQARKASAKKNLDSKKD